MSAPLHWRDGDRCAVKVAHHRDLGEVASLEQWRIGVVRKDPWCPPGLVPVEIDGVVLAYPERDLELVPVAASAAPHPPSEEPTGNPPKREP